jgi:signal transduction histidine kinase
MKTPLHILYLEHDGKDAGLVQAALEAEGIACKVGSVASRADYVAALERGNVDLILSDFSLPAFDGLAALGIARIQRPGVPFIIVSEKADEELAVESLKRGATDFVPRQPPARIVLAACRALREVEARAERQRLEEQFIEAQKMELMGQLASGVAHDFNNILAVIIGYSDLIRQELGPDHSLHKYAEEILRAGEHATRLTRQVLVFSRKQTVQPVVLNLNEVVKDLNKMLRRLINENVELTVVLGAQIGRVKADAGYVGQVLVNLVVNARDAMPSGGRLSIATSNVTLDDNHAHTHPEVVPGDYVMLAVSDTGVGMTDEIKVHLFEAFFTTKPKGKGTGLGLATCQTIVKQSGGHITADSELGKGATFKVYFPRVDQPVEVPARTAQTGPLPGGTETLLVVEDEPAVRHLANNVLENQGYTVLRATNGRDALRVAREHRGSPIRLVITDVIMPQMDGKVMAEWLKSHFPDLKILFTSGYTDDAIVHHGVLEPGVAFLAKPYSPATLTRKVREMLDTP